jgi:membrane-associated phospholipid phosphatase
VIARHAAGRPVLCVALLLPALAAGAPVSTSGGFGSNVHDVPAGEVAGIGATAAAALLVELLWHAPDPARWSGPILFDGPARDAFGAGSQGLRTAAARGSDVGELGLAAYPLIVDAGLVTWLSKGRGDVARRLLAVDVEAFALNGLLTSLVQRAVGRERPFAQGCGTAGHAACTSPDDRNTAFFSGHTSFAFTGATLLCFQHGRMNLYGDADGLVCPLALAVASATGLLRIIADRHWASDVLTGAAVGSAVGTAVSIAHISPGREAQSQVTSTGASIAIAF